MIPDMVYCKRVLLNRECVGNFNQGRGDIVYEGDCDDAVYMLAKLLGWEEELLEFNERTRVRGNRKDVAEENVDEKEDEETAKPEEQ